MTDVISVNVKPQSGVRNGKGTTADQKIQALRSGEKRKEEQQACCGKRRKSRYSIGILLYTVAELYLTSMLHTLILKSLRN